MKNILFNISILCFLVVSCSNSPSDKVKEDRRPVNFIVLLDLSDRLITKGQSERDIEIIKTVFEEFNASVRRNLVINSRDKFQVIIAPQKGVPYNSGDYENEMFIDMGSLNSGIKLNKLVEFEKSLNNILLELYSKAYLGSATSSYPGTDIWQFFNKNLEFLVGKDYDNKLVVITDGYFDLEDYSRQLPEGKRFPTTSFLSSARNKTDWKKIIESNDLGLIPVKKEFSDVKVFVAEINPKYDFQYESDMLIYVWKKWCREMKINVTEVLVKTSLPQTKDLLKSKLSANYTPNNKFISLAN
jgi:hypothetical protein